MLLTVFIALAHKIVDRSHHYVYAAAIALAAFFIAPALLHHAAPTPASAPVVVAIPQPGTVERESTAAVDALRAVAAASGNASVVDAGAVKALGDTFSAAAEAQWFHALGNDRTVPTYKLTVTAPTPAPAASTPPQISKDFASWYYTTTYNATSAALANTNLNLHVIPVPVPPSRTAALYLSDKSAGVSYAFARHKRLDFDIAATQGNFGLQPTLGATYHLSNAAGLFGGATLRDGKVNPVAGLSVSF